MSECEWQDWRESEHKRFCLTHHWWEPLNAQKPLCPQGKLEVQVQTAQKAIEALRVRVHRMPEYIRFIETDLISRSAVIKLIDKTILSMEEPND